MPSTVESSTARSTVASRSRSTFCSSRTLWLRRSDRDITLKERASSPTSPRALFRQLDGEIAAGDPDGRRRDPPERRHDPPQEVDDDADEEKDAEDRATDLEDRVARCSAREISARSITQNRVLLGDERVDQAPDPADPPQPFAGSTRAPRGGRVGLRLIHERDRPLLEIRAPGRVDAVRAGAGRQAHQRRRLRRQRRRARCSTSPGSSGSSRSRSRACRTRGRGRAARSGPPRRSPVPSSAPPPCGDGSSSATRP